MKKLLFCLGNKMLSIWHEVGKFQTSRDCTSQNLKFSLIVCPTASEIKKNMESTVTDVDDKPKRRKAFATRSRLFNGFEVLLFLIFDQ